MLMMMLTNVEDDVDDDGDVADDDGDGDDDDKNDDGDDDDDKDDDGDDDDDEDGGDGDDDEEDGDGDDDDDDEDGGDDDDDDAGGGDDEEHDEVDVEEEEDDEVEEGSALWASLCRRHAHGNFTGTIPHRKFTGKMGTEPSGDIVLCQPAQSKRTWDRVQEHLYGNLEEKRLGTPRTSFCASLRQSKCT